MFLMIALHNIENFTENVKVFLFKLTFKILQLSISRSFESGPSCPLYFSKHLLWSFNSSGCKNPSHGQKYLFESLNYLVSSHGGKT